MMAEPVSDSCDWLNAFACWTCRDDGAGRDDWYHGTWQYLRILNLVSTPTWHSSFLVQAMRDRAAHLPEARVLVSGSADYSMFAHAAAALGPRLTATVLDWCPTPLAATAWYARRQALRQPTLVCADAADHRPDGAYDLVVSDSFLPRFASTQLRRLLESWRVSLRDGGTAVTTARIHDSTSGSPASRPATAQRWRAKALESASWWPTVSMLPPAELAERVATFALRQERNAVYRESDLVDLFAEAGFKEIDCQVVDVEGRRFARLTAT